MMNEYFQRMKNAIRRFHNKYSERFCNTFTPLWYMTCVLGLNWMLDLYIFDYLHGKGATQAFIAKCLCSFMTIEMVVHWLFLCKVKSNYQNSEKNIARRVEHEKSNPQFTSEGIEYDKLKQVRSTLATGNWSVITQYTGSEVKRTAYPYWGWKPCIVCSWYKPPRCHHCPVCNICVLKRDHHCFFARQCVGLNNQRYFVVFNFWALLLTSFVTPQLAYYTRLAVWPSMTYLELFLPWTIVSYLLGWTKFYTLALISQNWSMVFYFLTSGGFLVEQLKCIDAGQTSFEYDKKSSYVQTRCNSRYERFACVFGEKHIWLNFLIPFHWASKPNDDGITWDSLKMQ